MHKIKIPIELYDQEKEAVKNLKDAQKELRRVKNKIKKHEQDEYDKVQLRMFHE